MGGDRVGAKVVYQTGKGNGPDEAQLNTSNEKRTNPIRIAFRIGIAVCSLLHLVGEICDSPQGHGARLPLGGGGGKNGGARVHLGFQRVKRAQSEVKFNQI